MLERIGRLKAKNCGTRLQYAVLLVKDESAQVPALTWEKTPVPGTMTTHPEVYCLRSSELSWGEERLWPPIAR